MLARLAVFFLPLIPLSLSAGCAQRMPLPAPDAARPDKAPAPAPAAEPEPQVAKPAASNAPPPPVSRPVPAAHAISIGRSTKAQAWGDGTFNPGTGVTALAASPKDEYLAVTGDSDGRVIVWDLHTGEPRPLLSHPGMAVRQVHFSPKGDKVTVLFVHSEKGESMVRVQLKNGRIEQSFYDPNYEILTVDPAGAFAISRGVKTDSDFQYFIENLEAKERLPSPEPHLEIDVQIFRGPQLIAWSGSKFNTWRLGKEIGNVRRVPTKLAKSTSSYLVSADGKTLYIALRDASIAAVDMANGTTRWTSPTQQGPLRAQDGSMVRVLGDSTDGRFVLTAYGKNEIWLSVLDAPSGTLQRRLITPLVSGNAAAISATGKTVIWVDIDGRLRRWDASDAIPAVDTAGHLGEVTSLLVQGSRVLSGSVDGTLRVWDPATGQQLRSIDAGGDAVVEVALARDGVTAATASASGYIDLWNLETGARSHLPDPAARREVTNLAFATDGSAVFAATMRMRFAGLAATKQHPTGWLDRWPLAKGWSPAEPGRTSVEVHDPVVAAFDAERANLLSLSNLCAFAPDLTRIADGKQTRSPINANEKDWYECANATALSFLPGEQQGLVGTDDGWLARFDIKTSEVAWHVAPLNSQVRAVAASDDGMFALAADMDGLLALVDARSGRLLARTDFEVMADAPTALAFLPGKEGYVVGTLRGMILRFALPALPKETAKDRPAKTPASDAGTAPKPLQAGATWSVPGAFAPEHRFTEALFAEDSHILLINDGNELHLVRRGDTTTNKLGENVTLLAVSAAGKWLATAPKPGQPDEESVQFRDLATGRVRWSWPLGKQARVFSAPAGDLAFACADKHDAWVDLSSSKVLSVLEPQPCLGLVPGGRRAAMAQDQAIAWWSLLGGPERGLGNLTISNGGADAHPTQLAFSPVDDGDAMGTSHGTVQLFDRVTNWSYATVTFSTEPVSALAFSKNGARLAALARNGDLVLIDTHTRQPIAQTKLPEDRKPLAIAVTTDEISVLDATGTITSY
jgi:WD40 repeat protein